MIAKDWFKFSNSMKVYVCKYDGAYDKTNFTPN